MRALSGLCAIAALFLFAASLPAQSIPVTFSFDPDEANPVGVFLAGEFNGWNSSGDPMTDENGDGVYETVIPLAPGTYMYKFVVDNVWYPDPSNDNQTDDGFGGFNSIVTVGAGDAAPAAAISEPVKAAEETTGDVLFRFDPDETNPTGVFVAGEFNGWNATGDPMTDEDGDGVYEAALPLAPGTYMYKFVVDNVWYPDPANDNQADDGFGGFNSIVTVGADGDAVVETASYATVMEEETGGTEIRSVPFTYHPESVPSVVYLAGSFNEWNPDAARMEGPDDLGAFHISMALAPGEYQYKFVADGDWYHDPENTETTDDGFGGFNSILRVGDTFEKIAIEKGDGQIRGEGLSLSGGAVSVVRMDIDRITITAKAYQGDLESASILFRHRGEETIHPMRELGGDGRYVYFRGELETGLETEGRIGIILRDGDATAVMTRGGLMEEATDAQLLEINAMSTPLFTMPDWVIDGVFYQIFPDRFFNGNPENDPDFTEAYYEGRNELPASGKTHDEYYHLVEDWNDYGDLKVSRYRTDGKPDWFSFYGGDMEGVTKKLPYLKDLGINIIYFNPVHRAKSNHKYDACNYREVDPHFGGNTAFRELVHEAHKIGIRVVVDGVFNHTGNCHYAFEDCLVNGHESPYWNWYEWKKWPLPELFSENNGPINYYECWWGFGDLPNLNFDLSRPNPAEQSVKRIADAKPNWPVVEDVMEAVRFWLGEMGADGFRLDVPNEVPSWVWKLFREEARRVNPDSYIVAELWGNAVADLSPLGFDATMNYKYFREPALGFFARGSLDAKTFDMQLAGGRYGYPLPSVLGSMNLFGSHDTERFLTLAGGDRRKLLLAYLFSATYVGVPHIYYGDEIGMEGARDPDCRRPFHWDEMEDPSRAALREKFSQYFHIRADHKAFRRGEFRTLLADGRVFAYARWDEEEKLAVILNAGNTAAEISLERSSLPFEVESARDLLSGVAQTIDGDKLTVRLEPWTGAVLEF